MPITSVSAPAAHDRTTELRLALVLYGGVSLAIYMHGVTKELLRLVVASRAFTADPATNPFAEGTVEHAYFEVLAERLETQREHVSVVVDVIAGTSAGGINGVCLAKALAGNLGIESVVDVWLDIGDIDRLIVVPTTHTRPWDGLEARLVERLLLRKAGLEPAAQRKAALWALRSARGLRQQHARAPLDGDLMYREIAQALDRMDASRLSDAETLMPDGLPIDLLVTTTDFYGYDHAVPVNDPVRVLDRRHRHVMPFSSAVDGSFDAADNPALAFACRATSSFPGAFSPISLANITQNLGAPWPGLGGFLQRCFPIYPLSNASAEQAWFVDGGVLDNYPFRLAMDAIRRKGASTRVDRRLVYVEPSPSSPTAPSAPGNASEPMPTIMKTVWGGLSGIPSQEPILEDLEEQHQRNDRLRRLRDALEAAAPQVASQLSSYADLAEARAKVTEAATRLFGYTGYARLKLLAVVDAMAATASQVCGYPPDAAQARFAQDTLHAWAASRDLLAVGAQLTAEQVAFLVSFDLGYSERRIRALVALINELYERDGLQRPARADLDAAKRALYERGLELTQALEVAVAQPGVRDVVREVFVDRLGPLLYKPDGPQTLAGEAGELLDRAREAIAASLKEQLSGFADQTFGIVERLIEQSDEEVGREVTTTYVGFPYWDYLTFPLRAAGDVGEFDPVQVVRLSPIDVHLLTWPGRAQHEPKLEGTRTHHFGAFFRRAWRENDYLWGRLDAAERLVHLLLGDDARRPAAKASPRYAEVFAAIVAEERKAGKLREVDALLASLDEQVAELRTAHV